ncbi:MAG: hypothetical protein ABIJ46_01640 [bacterium]
MDISNVKPVETGGIRPEIESGPEAEAIPEGESSLVERPVEPEDGRESPTEPAEAPVPSVPPAPPSVPPALRSRDPLLLEVERHLESDLWEVYADMPEQVRVRFRQEGERIAQVIRDGLQSGRMAAHSIMTLVVRWLKMIPGVNRWFLVQEAKIKTDSLASLGRETGDGQS